VRRTGGLGPPVMGTGIVSIALSVDGRETLSWIWFALAAICWGMQVLSTVVGLTRDRARHRPSAADVAQLSAVAATCVLGSRLVRSGEVALGFALLVAAAGIAALAFRRAARAARLIRSGRAFLLTVAPASLAVLAALLAARERAIWLWWAALAACALGLFAYLALLTGFDRRALRAGRGDQWVAGGALAISALAVAELSRYPAIAAGAALHAVAVALWASSVAWLVALIAYELYSPRLRHDPLRWSTVFPVGMYAVSSFVVSEVARLPALTSFASV
jgi:hypothetical protein